jgi:hypothetical protein
MKRTLAGFLLAAVCMAPSLADAVSEEDFKAKNTQAVLNLCTASPDDPAYSSAIHFCHGYLLGAYQYHIAENSGPEGNLLVCIPDPSPTRDEAVRMFIDWAKAHPQYMKETAAETEFRFLTEKWPCKR